MNFTTKHTKSPFSLTRLLTVAFAGLWLAAASQGFCAEGVERAWIAPQSLSPQLLPPPPAESSQAHETQIDMVIAAQRSLSPAEISAIRSEATFRVSLMTDTLGPAFDPKRMPKTVALLNHVELVSSAVVDAAKKYWHTKRPYLVDPRVKLYVDSTTSFSYPSGHTAESRILAEVLGQLFPDQLPDLRARAEDIARHRVEAGVHYPVDLEAGRLLAMLVVGALATNRDFQADLNAAREEILNLKK
jgi:acid phosphatase (class A)